MSGAPTLTELWQMAAMHHRALRGFAAAHVAHWNISARRTAWHGLAVLAAMLRRLIHLMARDVALPPPSVRDDDLPPLPTLAPRRPALRFRLTESERPQSSRAANPDRVPDSPAFDHARFLDRLAVLAEVYRARARLARRLGRRAQTGRARLRTPPLPPRLRARVRPGLLEVLDHLGHRLAAPDTS